MNLKLLRIKWSINEDKVKGCVGVGPDVDNPMGNMDD
jgi:hypothetical protein